jgi:hypothetical protein
MRRLVLLTVLAFGLLLPGVGFGGSGDDATLSVRNGLGKVGLNFNGSVVGRVAHGKIVATDPVVGDGSGVVFWGCDRPAKPVDFTTTVCSGENLRFRAIGGRYVLAVRGSGISLSVVGRGVATLNGAGDDPDVPRDGVYSLNDSPYKSLPDNEKQVPLVAPAGG